MLAGPLTLGARTALVFTLRLSVVGPVAVVAGPSMVEPLLESDPTGSHALRRLTAPLDVAGHRLPSDTTTILPIPLLQRDRHAFASPDEFQPKRWLSGPASEGYFLPFGGGLRRCLGEQLAQMYFATVVPAVMRHVTLRPLRPRPERMVVRATTLVPHRSALVTATAAA